MSFQRAPYPDDVPEDLGPYSRDEIVAARMSLLHSVQRENAMVWQGIKYKLGILPDGRRLRCNDPPHIWLPKPLPQVWSVPVVLYDPQDENGQADRKRKGPSRTASGSSTPNSHRSRSPDRPRSSSSQERRLSSQIATSSSSSLSSGGKRKRESEDRELPSSSGAKTSISSSKRLKQGATGGQSDSAGIREVGDWVGKRERAKLTEGVEDRNRGVLSFEADVDFQKDKGSLPPSQDAGDNSYYTMFQCDFCRFLTLQEKEMWKHLRKQDHYSASTFLGSVDQGVRHLTPEYLVQTCTLTEPKNLLKGFVPVCPVCHAVFTDVSQCVSHTQSSHHLPGSYGLRAVIKSHNFFMSREVDECQACLEKFDSDGLRKHIIEEGHMRLYNCKKRPHKMVAFPCLFCSQIECNYFAFKQHVFSEHDSHTKDTDVLEVTCLSLGKHVPSNCHTLPPPGSGIPAEKILQEISDSKSAGSKAATSKRKGSRKKWWRARHQKPKGGAEGKKKKSKKSGRKQSVPS